jgi:alpha-tubulin suppressor-like RCC1 family protein/thiamine kinase-like enzyme
MEDLMTKYKELKNLEISFVKNIKYLYISKDYVEEYHKRKNVFIISKDDQFFYFGVNRHGESGFRHKYRVKELSKVEVLCNKQIIDLKKGQRHVIARTTDGKVYCWGESGFGVFGNGINDDSLCSPFLIECLSNEKVVETSCGCNHTLLLTSNGEVYAWGWNKNGEIGIGSDVEFQTEVVKLNAFNEQRIRAISCGSQHSLVLTESGIVYSWGFNSSGQLGIGNNKNSFKPMLIERNEVLFECISCGSNISLLLSKEKDIYVFGFNIGGQLGTGENWDILTPKKLIHSNKFIEISSHYHNSLCAALSENGVFYVWGGTGSQFISTMRKTEFKSFEDIFAHYFKITHKTIDVEKRFRNGKYSIEFTEIRIIASGGFGIVCEAKNKINNQFYAIKKIPIDKQFEEKAMKEIEILSKLKNDIYIVRFESAWIEDNYVRFDTYKKYENISSGHNVFNPYNTFLLHIQMELCSKTLLEIMKQINMELNQKVSITPLGYSISSELFIEMLESVDYLHKENIIHRDLKPGNILITDGMNGRFVKIADFGLATIHEFVSQSHTKGLGTCNYMAPEVLNSSKYDTRADIYSLGFIVQELFNIDINEYEINNMIIVNVFILNNECFFY